mgnify:CR=1 FL=1
MYQFHRHRAANRHDVELIGGQQVLQGRMLDTRSDDRRFHRLVTGEGGKRQITFTDEVSFIDAEVSQDLDRGIAISRSARPETDSPSPELPNALDICPLTSDHKHILAKQRRDHADFLDWHRTALQNR